ncbi:hypothetical protein MKEN_00497600 [Mycena kentingensis (nom. inval.)]|nr:hypothetical protein MKEN_00497600 [Mycena kentingensis (nom. inval.)]
MQEAPPTPSLTHPSLHIRDINDAHRVLQAVRLNVLPLVRRRLSLQERNRLQSGNVFVWEESESEDGLVRWTEGKRWSQSRMRGDCLIYEEKIETTQAERREKSIRRQLKLSDSPEPIPPAPKRKDRPTKVDGLTKHTYSVTVKLPSAANGTRKWHLVAYFSAQESSSLPVVEDYPYLRNIEIPRGVFGGHGHAQSHKSSARGSLDLFPGPQIPGAHVFRAISPADLRPPSSEQVYGEHAHGHGHALRRLSVLHTPAVQLHPHPNTAASAALVDALPPISPATSPMPLPPLSSLGGYFFSKPTPAHALCSAPTAAALSPDDRRILERFRVVI